MVNRIVAENAITAGVAPSSYWDVAHSTQIEGFATDFSVNAGTRVDFKINVNGGAGSDYKVEIFRLGYYGGNGAREVAEWVNTNATVQPNALYDSTRALVDAGNWSVTDGWDVPADAVSGVYLARLQRLDASGNPVGGAVNQIPFVVRNDGVAADVVLQTSDTTWQAYNGWFGNNGQVGANFYGDASGTVDHPDIPTAGTLGVNRAYAVSYNRPFITRDGTSPASGAQDYLFGADYAAIYWLEKQGYDVSYISGVDTDRLGSSYLTNYKAFISVGHDEYWSGGQRDNVEAARDAGVNLLFWSGNEVYWKTRWETSISADGTPYRTLVCYKETWANADPNAGPADYANLDPSNIWTGTWRDTRFHGNPLAGGGNPSDVDPISGLCPTCNCGENKLTGTIFGPDGTGEFGGALDVPAQFAGLRVWRNTSVANGGQLDIAPGIIGYEWDTSPDDILRPQGLIKLSETTLPWGAIVVDQGNTTQPGVATHNLTLYRAQSGALVFGAGTVFWSWALSDQHDSSPYGAQIENTDLQQFAMNMFADMGIQPGVADAVLISQGLMRATGSTDTVAATAAVDDLPASLTALSPVIISGTATDDDGNPLTADGKVAVVEVSFDGGLTWKVASSSDAWATWSYTWIPTHLGNQTIIARAIDDSLNVAGALAGTETVTIAAPDVFSLFGGLTPTGTLVDEGRTVELGTRIIVDRAGSVTQLKYWRAAADANDTDTRAGHLWAADGTLLAAVTFTSNPGESGWQVATLSGPVALQAGVEYIVSYRSADNYFATTGFFDPSHEVAYDGLDNGAFSGPFGVVRAPEDGNGGGNGVYAYGSGAPRFPDQSFQGGNYWVDVTFNPVDTTNNRPPVFTSSAAISTPENQVLVGLIGASDPDGNALNFAIVGGTDAGLFTINATTGLLSFAHSPNFEAPADFGGDNVYQLTVSVGDGLAAPVTQNLTVSVTDVNEAPNGSTVFGPTDAPAQINVSDPADYELGMKFQSAANGWITELRYFRGAADAADTDIRTLNLWSITGVRLAQASVQSAPGSTGWQVAALTAPVAIQANTTYVVSYGTTQNYALSGNYFATAHVGAGGLSAPSSGAAGGNGVFAPDAPGSFPTQTFNASNYWVDVAFQQTLGSPPAFTSSPDVLAFENQTLAAQLVAADPDNDPLVFAIAGGADAGLFTLNASTGALSFTAPPDFEAPQDADRDNVYEINVTVSDGTASPVLQALRVTVSDVAEVPPNRAPAFTSAAAATAAENQSLAAQLAAADPDGDALVFAIAGGADAALFTLNVSTGVLSFVAAPDFEAPGDANGDNVYEINVTVSDGTATPVLQALQVTVSNVAEVPPNQAPAFTSASAATAAENQNLAAQLAASDPDNDPLVFAIAGGADAAFFTLNASTGVLSFTAPPDFEAPQDADRDNIYEINVTVSDGTAAPVLQALRVTVSDVADTNAPPIVSPITAPNTNEDAAPVQINLLAGASDPEGAPLSVSGPVTVSSSNPGRTVTFSLAAGVLSFDPAQFGNLAAGQNETLTIAYQISDGVNGVANTATITVDGRDEVVPGQVINGSSGPNVLNGGAGNDTIRGLAGNDTLNGNDGDDTLDGGVGTDTVDGGNGNDILLITTNQARSDVLIGGAGSDTLRLTGTADVELLGTSRITGVEILDGAGLGLKGTSGDEVFDLSIFTTVTQLRALLGLAGQDTLTGSSANDTIDGGAGTDTIRAGGGDDTILMGGVDGRSDTMDGGAGIDTLRFIGTADVELTGTSRISGIEFLDGGGRTAKGTSAADVLDLSIFVSVSNLAVLQGLGGNDALTGSTGADVLDGGAGSDTVLAGDGDDTILLSGSQGQNDTLAGGAGLDTILAVASGGNIVLLDTTRITGVERFDGSGLAILGQGSVNVLDFSGIDLRNVTSIQGLGGNDTLAGGLGDDLLVGGMGNDAFLFRSGLTTGDDTISDFDAAGNDVIRLAGYNPGVNLAGATSFDAQGALIDLTLLGGDGTIRLSGVTNLAFTSEDFVFV